MLAIRLQRIGRTGHAMYRIAVQEAQRNPSSGRVIAYVGIYDPHTKQANIQAETAQKFLDNGAQPSPRVIKLLKEAGVKMPAWVKEFTPDKEKTTRNATKLRKNQPTQPKVEAPVAEPVADAPEVAVEKPVEKVVEVVEESATEPGEAVEVPVEPVEPAADAEVTE